MKALVLALTLAVVSIGGLVSAPAQTPAKPEAYPGQRDHKEPPKGFFCSPNAKDKAHECHCKRMSHPTVEDPSCCETEVVEDAACTVWCYPQRCLCPVSCDVKVHQR